MVRSSSPRLVVAPWRELASELASDLAPRLERLRSLRGPTSPPIVVVPGGGVARGVQIELASRFRDGFVSPLFLTIERLAESVLSSTPDWRPPTSGSLLRLAMDAAARESGGLLEPQSLAALAYRSWRDAVDAGVNPFDLARRADPQQREFVRHAEKVWRRYRTLLGAAAIVDPGEMLEDAVAALRSGSGIGGIVALYGFYDATGMQTRVLRTLIETGNIEAVYLPGSMSGDGLDEDYRFAERLIHDLGVAAPSAPTAAQGPGVVSLIPTLSPSLQQKWVCDSIAEEIAKGATTANIAIIARAMDSVSVEMWSRAADQRGFPLERRALKPLSSFRIGRAIEILLRLRERDFQRNDVLDLLDIGIRGLGDIERSTRAIATLTRDRSIPSGRSAVLRERFTEDESEALNAYIAAVAFFERLTANTDELMTSIAWADAIAEWMESLKVRTDEDFRALDRIDSWLSELRLLGSTRITRGEIVQNFRRIDVEASHASGVFIGDFMQARGRAFDTVFLVDAIEGMLPQGRIQDPLIPDDLRVRAGMRAIGSNESEERMLFRAVLDSARRVTIVWPENDESGRTTRLSPLVSRLMSSRYPDQTAAILRDPAGWARGRAAASPGVHGRDERLARSIARGSTTEVALPVANALRGHGEIGSRGRWDGYLPANAELRERLVERLGATSPTTLEKYGECPHQFLVKGVLRIPEARDPRDLLELESKDKGTAMHAALERFHRSLDPKHLASWDPERRSLTPELDDLLSHSVDEAFAAMKAQTPPRFRQIRELERIAALRDLRKFLVGDLKELSRSGFVPKHFEFAFGERRGVEGDAPAAVFEVRGISVTVRGTIDRVDVAADGRVRIVDYKSTGSRYRGLGDKVEQGLALQLAMYCRAWMTIHGTPESHLSAAILPLRGERIKAELLSFEYAAIAQRLDFVLSRFAEGILSGWFPAIPGKHCDYCPVATGCRERHDGELALELEDLTALSLLWSDGESA